MYEKLGVQKNKHGKRLSINLILITILNIAKESTIADVAAAVAAPAIAVATVASFRLSQFYSDPSPQYSRVAHTRTMPSLGCFH